MPFSARTLDDVVLDDVAAKNSCDHGLVGRVVPTKSGAGDDLQRGRRKSAHEGLVHVVRKVTARRSGSLGFCLIESTRFWCLLKCHEFCTLNFEKQIVHITFRDGAGLQLAFLCTHLAQPATGSFAFSALAPAAGDLL